MFLHKKIILYLFLTILYFFVFQFSYSATIDEIKQKIEATSNSREQIQKEIDAYQLQIKNIESQAITLENTIKTINATEKKILASIRLNENNIDATELEIERLSFEISKKEIDIRKNSKIIFSLINQVNESDQISLIESLLAYPKLSDFWTDTENIYQIQNKIRQKLTETKNIRDDLAEDKKESEYKKNELIILKKDLDDQKIILGINKKEKSTLLTETKNKESNYKKILAEKQALADAFDRELAQFESELKFAIDPNSIPRAGKGILSWPLDSIFITQKYGVTADSGKLYLSGSHNGVDFRASVGTRVKSALSGTVEGIGDTDLVCDGASYGKWILIRHDNGLTTLYGHLSLIKVRTGDRVFTGDIIGYSGNTGYSTGPHLHLSLFASQGVKIMSKKSTVCRGTYTLPMADLRAYLNPLEYL